MSDLTICIVLWFTGPFRNARVLLATARPMYLCFLDYINNIHVPSIVHEGRELAGLDGNKEQPIG